TDSRPGRASRPSTESIAPRQARAGNRAAPPPTTRQSSPSPKRNGDGQSKAATAGPAPWPVEQPALPGLPVSRQLTLGAASASPLKQRHQAQLQLVLDVLARHG